jgi:PAS domain S-box-containing protein
MKVPTLLKKFERALFTWLRGHRRSLKSLTAKMHLEELRKSEALLAEAEQIGRLGSWEHNLVTGEDVWSANLCRMLDIDPTKTRLSEDLFWELLHPDDREAVRTIIEGGMRFAHEYEYQSRFIIPGGRERTFYTWGKPILGPDKQVIKRMGMTQDISIRVEAERALLESEERYRDLVESSHDLICTHDLSGRILSMNELPARILGYCPEELIGRSIPDQLSGGATAQFGEYIERIKRDGFANGLMVLMTKAGERRVWEYQNTLRTEGVSEPLVRGMAHDVTERVKAQKALRESTARLQALVNSIDQIAFEFDVEGTFLDIWTTNETLLFRPREQLLGRRVSDVVGEELGSIYKNIFRRVLRSGRGEDLEYSLRLVGGERWFLGRVTPIVAPDGAYKSICMLARDITDRKQAEKSLSLFRALIDRSNDAIEVVDPITLRFLDVNQKACSDLGYTREEILLMSIKDIDPTMNAETHARVNEALRQSGSLIKETIHRRKDGSTFPVEININLIQLDKTYVVTVARDITDRKQEQDKLHESEARLRLATQAGRMYAFEWDAATDVVVRSEECTDILGPDEPTHSTLKELLDAVCPDDLQNFDLGVLNPGNASANVKYRVLRSDGSVIWVENTARAFFDEQGKMLRIIGMVADITARRQAEDALREKETTIRSLFHIAKTLTNTLELDAILEHLNYESMMLVGTEGSFARLLGAEEFTCDSFFDRSGPKKECVIWPPGVGLLGWVLTNKKTYLTNDAAHDPLIPPEIHNPLGLRSVLCVPVLGNQQEVIAFFALLNKRGGDFRPSDVEIVEGISKVASIAIQNALAYKRTCQAEENLRVLSAQLINLQDEERRRIALDLHEGLAQDLAALRLSLGQIKRKTAKKHNGVAGIINESLELNDGLIQQTRALSYKLHPAHLEEVGLPLAITSYARKFSELSGIEVSVRAELPEDIGFPHGYEITIFRIVQECLSNVGRHSHSQMATVCVSFENEHLILEVADRGRGIAFVSGTEVLATTTQGIGIASMRERVKQMHGTFLIESIVGQGVTVRVALPVATASLERHLINDSSN